MSQNKHNAKTPFQHEQDQLKNTIQSQKLVCFERLITLEDDALLMEWTKPSVAGGLSLVQGYLPFNPEAARLLQHLFSEEYRLTGAEKTMPSRIAKAEKDLETLEAALPVSFVEKRRRYEFLCKHVSSLENALTKGETEIATARATIEASRSLLPQQQQHLFQQMPMVLTQILATTRTSFAEMQYAQQKQQIQETQARAFHALLNLTQETARKAALMHLLNERRRLRDRLFQELCQSHL